MRIIVLYLGKPTKKCEELFNKFGVELIYISIYEWLNATNARIQLNYNYLIEHYEEYESNIC